MTRWLIVLAAGLSVVAVWRFDALAHTCESGCALEQRACFLEARFGHVNSRVGCGRSLAECNGSCDGDRGACRAACGGGVEQCRNACGSADDILSCGAACEADTDLCRAACAGSREDCRARCDSERNVCVTAADSEHRWLTVACDHAAVGCREVCLSDDECLDACGRAAGICFGQARPAFTACRAQCSDGPGGRPCRRSCRAEQVSTNGACTDGFRSCLEGCEPGLPTTTAGEPSPATTTP